MPSPESPAKRMVTRSSTWTGLVIVKFPRFERTGTLHPVAASSRPPGAQRPTTPRAGGRQPALPAYTDPFEKLVEPGGRVAGSPGAGHDAGGTAPDPSPR